MGTKRRRPNSPLNHTRIVDDYSKFRKMIQPVPELIEPFSFGTKQIQLEKLCVEFYHNVRKHRV